MNRTLQSLLQEYTPRLLDIPEAAAAAPREGRTWTRKQELGHLVDSAINNYGRFVRASLDEEYTGPGYDADGWVDLNGYAEQPWAQLVLFWRDLNLQVERVISRIPEDWHGSPCTIGQDAPVTLGFLMDDYKDHMLHHLRKILS